MSASTIIQQLNGLLAEAKAKGWLVEGAGKIRAPEAALEIENRWLRRKIERLTRVQSTPAQDNLHQRPA